MKAWIARAGSFRVEHVPCPHPGVKVDDGGRHKGVLHTTEGPTVEGALSVFRQHYAPHFTVGRDSRKRVRILQHVPLGYMATTVKNAPGGTETNREARVQIEIVGFSKRELWLPETGTLNALVALLRVLAQQGVVPPRHVAVNRNVALWDRTSAWLGHADVPENDHWDPGRLRWNALMSLVRAPVKAQEVAVMQEKPRKLDAVRTLPLKLRSRKAEQACPAEDVGPPAPGEGDDLPNPEIDMEC